MALTRSERYLCLTVVSTLTSEVWLLDATDPTGQFRVVVPRRQGVEYSVEHQVAADGGDRLLILHNEHAENFELSAASLADPSTWTTAHRRIATTPGCSAWTPSLITWSSTSAGTGSPACG